MTIAALFSDAEEAPPPLPLRKFQGPEQPKAEPKVEYKAVERVLSDDVDPELVGIILQQQPAKPLAVAGVHHRATNRIRRQIYEFLRGNPSALADIAAHVHRSTAFPLGLIRGMRITETAPDEYTLDDEVP